MTTASKITVIGNRLAKPGETFYFLEEQAECKKCKIRGTCLNLDSGRKYEVVSVRNSTLLDCELHDGGVLAVNVKKAPIEAFVDSKKAVVGAKISFDPVKVKSVDDDDAPNVELFAPKGLLKGDKCVVKEVFEGVEKDGKTYKRVILVLE
ncbi:MAG: UPF0179 family protein [Methanimicrococcus sp.]|nr:UPF0179 family protein [Methanimicrococcus sp.]